MKEICILIPQNAILASIADPRYAFTAVNEFRRQEGLESAFNIQLIGLLREVSLNDGLFTIHTDKLLGEVKKADMVIIPALGLDMDHSLEVNRKVVPWLAEQYATGTELVSLCTGAFLLAETGLLAGRQCSTHWIAADDFRKRYPDVDLVTDRIITEQQGIYSSGGASSYWNLLLYIIEKYAGRDMAIRLSKYFAIEISRRSQSPFMIFKGQKEHEDDAVRNAQDFLETNFQEKITVDVLAEKAGAGRRTFERRFRSTTGNTVMEYLQRVRIEAAKKNFESGLMNVNEVMYSVGYSDLKAFRSVFKKLTGMSPQEYRTRYKRVAVLQ